MSYFENNMKVVGSIAFFLVGMTSASAFQAGAMYDTCKSPDPLQTILCTYYVKGVTDGLEMGVLSVISGTKTYCPPADLKTEAAKDIILGFISTYPKVRETDAGVTAGLALKKAFSCPH